MHTPLYVCSHARTHVHIYTCAHTHAHAHTHASACTPTTFTETIIELISMPGMATRQFQPAKLKGRMCCFLPVRSSLQVEHAAGFHILAEALEQPSTSAADCYQQQQHLYDQHQQGPYQQLRRIASQSNKTPQHTHSEDSLEARLGAKYLLTIR